MTDLLAELHHSFGLLDVTVMTMDQARAAWAGALGPVKTDAELRQMRIAEDETVLIVRGLGDLGEAEWNIRDANEGDLELLSRDSRGKPKKATVWELPPSEFHYFRAFRTGIADLAKDLPAFFYGMTLVHAWGLFEHYLGSLLLRILLGHTEMLGRAKQLDLGRVLDHPSKEALLASVAVQEVRGLFYNPVRDWLKVLRGRYKLKGLSRTHDDHLVETALVRNCVVHNRGFADSRLAEQSGGRYTEGVQIGITQDSVSKATDVLRKFASAVDEIAIQVHCPVSNPKPGASPLKTSRACQLCGVSAPQSHC